MDRIHRHMVLIVASSAGDMNWQILSWLFNVCYYKMKHILHFISHLTAVCSSVIECIDLEMNVETQLILLFHVRLIQHLFINYLITTTGKMNHQTVNIFESHQLFLI